MSTTIDELDGARPDTGAPVGLAALLQDAKVADDVLDERYHALLQLVDVLLGVVPNCDRYLEIWPPAFRAYNLMVPNLLDLPVPVLGLGGPPASVVGLAMYVASRTAECPYCSAHSCSFAMRRGASPATVAAALVPDRDSFSRGELAAVAVARSLARVPGELTAAEKAELVDVFGEDGAEWIVLSVVMMGFLNKFMDAIGVELEQGVVDETVETLGAGWNPGRAGAELDPASSRSAAPPADSWRTKLRLLPLLPAAIRYDGRVQQGMPKKPAAIAEHLRALAGHDFPVLASLRSNRARRAIASMLRENLDPSTSVVGLGTKVLCGSIYATVVGDVALLADIHALAAPAGVDEAQLAAAEAFARRDGPAPTSAALLVARAASTSPAGVDATIIEACRREGLSPEAVVEVVSWLATLQLLHRLHGWVAPAA